MTHSLKATEIRSETTNDYIITRQDGEARGIFFRSPVQQVSYSTDDGYDYEPHFSAWKWVQKNKNVLFRIWQTIMGNGYVVKHINEWTEDMSWAGFSANILCCPVYFRREYRKLEVTALKPVDGVKSIVSSGFESEWNTVGGHCKRENTKITFSTGRRLRSTVKNGSYHYTYPHIVKEVFPQIAISV